MNAEERLALRSDQVVRYLESGMGSERWGAENGVAPRTLRRWAARLRGDGRPRAEGAGRRAGARPPAAPAAARWVEVDLRPARGRADVAPAPASPAPEGPAAPLRVAIGRAVVEVPAGYPEAALASALRAVASL